MKTCKDCIYYETYKQQGEEYQRTFMVTVHACRLYPKTEKVDGKGCGQLKEKVHVIYSIEDEPPDAQWTPEELKRLKARDAPPLEINKIKKSNIVDEIEAFFQDKP